MPQQHRTHERDHEGEKDRASRIVKQEIAERRREHEPEHGYRVATTNEERHRPRDQKKDAKDVEIHMVGLAHPREARPHDLDEAHAERQQESAD